MSLATLPGEPASILLYGDTESGKTQQIGFFSKWLFRQTGGKIVQGKAQGGLRTRLYCADEARWKTIQPFVNVGLVEPISLLEQPHAWVWLDAISKGKVPKGLGWVKEPDAQIGCYAFDSLTGMSDLVMLNLAARGAKGENIGGGGSYKIIEGNAQTGVVEFGANNQTHYGVTQSRLLYTIGQMNRLLAKPAYVIATATARRGQEDTQTQVMGPQVAGKALTTELPRLFTYTFHLLSVPKATEEPEHQLWAVSHVDRTAGNAKGLANRRVPLAAPGQKSSLPPYLSPADIGKMMDLIIGGGKATEEALIKELS